MTAADIVTILEQKFGERIKSKKLDAIDPFVVVDAADIVAVCRFLRDDTRLRFEILNSVCGTDYLEIDPKKAPKAGFDPHLEVVYHLSSFGNRPSDRILRFTVKVLLPRWKDNKPGELPECPSVTSVWHAADWHERETYDMFGIWFTGHPDLHRILLSEDWVGYPLRKDYEFPLEYHGIRGR
jgi:NADH-quinone oxidoreductase subunit C